MQIDLTKIGEDGIKINDVISFSDTYLEHSDIQKLDNVKVDIRIYSSITNEIVLEGTMEGTMVLLDAITLEPIDYPFNISLDEVLSDSENVSNDEKILDIMDVLWQNIVLEVPISIKKDESNHDLHGEGWELVEEETNEKVDPRLAPLLELLDKEGKE